MGAVTSSEPPTEFRVQACASPLPLESVETIASITTVTLLAPLTAVGLVELEATRDAIHRRQCFSVRYFMREGARRAIVQAVDVREHPGMRDVVRVRLLSDPVPAPERQASRTTVEVRLGGSVLQAENLRPGTPIGIQVMDVSTGGVGFVSPAPFVTGDLVLLAAPARDLSPDAELEVVRRDASRASRFGGRFTDADVGGAFSTSVIRTHRAAVPRPDVLSPLVAPDLDEPRNGRGGMHTRDDDDRR